VSERARERVCVRVCSCVCVCVCVPYLSAGWSWWRGSPGCWGCAWSRRSRWSPTTCPPACRCGSTRKTANEQKKPKSHERNLWFPRFFFLSPPAHPVLVFIRELHVPNVNQGLTGTPLNTRRGGDAYNDKKTCCQTVSTAEEADYGNRWHFCDSDYVAMRCIWWIQPAHTGGCVGQPS